MKQSKLGNQGLVASQMGLGCMGMSEFYGNSDDTESLRTINHAIDAGINLLDTSDIYGPFKNEVLLGKVLKERRHEVVLATKFGIVRSATDPTVRGFNGTPEYCKKACDNSLQRLGIDTIDLYYLHRVDPNVPIEETVGAMADLVKEGKVRYIGLSEAAPATLRRAFKVHPVSALQTEYSLWSREPEDEIIPTCRELGIGFVPYSPLGRGFLTGEIKSFDDLAADDFRRFSPRFQGENFNKNLVLVDKIKQLASQKGCTASQLALAWVMAQGDDVFPIPGTRRIKYLDENMAAADIKLTADELTEINSIAPKNIAVGDRYPAASMQFLNG
ncbi:aldo/keto reductase [Emticicia sp. 21SJ11W-3]|uniref:aldo/keto reductase n=1 Tax=Emticicia sp. 21SJ11W-3 TaxID=2916755 RepID=UPI0020A2059D|nr:aldo/keto reductase [Emticicia sp. 21SJ11W-3]UTA68477.1 aldo/keto reductase [Emticicia sp. 21SJ11W-3]